MPLGTEVDFGPGHIVLDGFPALGERGIAAPSFRPMSIVATVAHLLFPIVDTCLTCEHIARQSHAMVRRWRMFG